NPLTDLTAVTQVVDVPSVLVANGAFSAGSVKELVDLAKASPGKLNYGSPGSGSVNRLEMELLRIAEGLDMVHVPYKGGAGPAVAGLMGGETHVMFTTAASAIGQVRGGKLKLLAVTSPRRMEQAPSAPTMVESGYPDFVTGSWQGVFVPAGTPRDIVERLFTAVQSTMGSPELAERLKNGGAEVVTSQSSAAFAEKEELPFSPQFEDALKDPQVQGVVLCTPHTLHTEQIVRAAGAKKHVFCEKPLSLSRADVLRAVEACNRNKVALAVGHEKRFEPPVQELVHMAKRGELGTLLQIEANFVQDKFLSLPADNWRLSGREAPAGPMTATGIHLLDLSVGLLGPAARVFASVRQLGSQLTNGDTLGILVSFKSGANALLSAILATPFDGRLAVYGNKGWAEVRDKAHPEAPLGWVLTKTLKGKEKQSVDYPPATAVLANLEAFADAAAG